MLADPECRRLLAEIVGGMEGDRRTMAGVERRLAGLQDDVSRIAELVVRLKLMLDNAKVLAEAQAAMLRALGPSEVGRRGRGPRARRRLEPAPKSD